MENRLQKVIASNWKQNKLPLQVVGVINPYSAILARDAGHQAIYISGGALAAALGLPDLGVLNAHDIATLAASIKARVDLPILVDADTGYGNLIAVERATQLFAQHNIDAMHLEDQVDQKRCGHRNNKQLVDTSLMSDRIATAVAAAQALGSNLQVMARTDALAVAGLDEAQARLEAYVKAGASMIFLEAAKSISDYQQISNALPGVPLLANITEFGKTPAFSLEQLATARVQIALYPVSAFRAMNKAAFGVYSALAKEGSVNSVLDSMQTRDELYEHLQYKKYEDLFDVDKEVN